MKCKICNCEFDGSYSPYCPNCGARADEKSTKSGSKMPLVIALIVLGVLLVGGGVFAAIKFGFFDFLFGSGSNPKNEKNHGENAEGFQSEVDNAEDLFYSLLGDGTYDTPATALPDNDQATADTEPSFEETKPAIEETAPPETTPPETTPPETTPPEPVWEGSSRVVIANGGLNMRSSPSLSAGIINCIPNGNIITVEKVQDNWAYVSYGGGYGWCSCDYLFVPIEIDASPIYTATVRCYDKIEMVSEGYAKDDVVYTDVFNGTVVSVYEIDGDRAFIKYNNIYGWCSKAYLELY